MQEAQDNAADPVGLMGQVTGAAAFLLSAEKGDLRNAIIRITQSPFTGMPPEVDCRSEKSMLEYINKRSDADRAEKSIVREMNGFG